MKKIVEFWKDFFGYFNALETHSDMGHPVSAKNINGSAVHFPALNFHFFFLAVKIFSVCM